MTRNLRQYLGAVSLLAATAGAASAQNAELADLPTGVRLGIGFGVSTAVLSGDSKAIVNAAGSVEPGPPLQCSSVTLTADIVRYRNLAPSGDNPIVLSNPGTTVLPRLLVSLQFSPFTSTR